MVRGSSSRRGSRSAKKGVLFALLVIALSVAAFASSGLVAGATDPSTNVSCASASGVNRADNSCNPCDTSGDATATTNDGGDCNPCDTSGDATATTNDGGDCNPCDTSGDASATTNDGGDCNPCDTSGDASATTNDGEGGGCNPCDVKVITPTEDNESSGNVDKCWTNTTQVIAEGDPGTDITNGSAPLGTTVHDEATVGNPLLKTTDSEHPVVQNVNFTLYPGLECTGDPLQADNVDISAPDTVSSPSQTLPAGDYSYRATYTRTKTDGESGDASASSDSSENHDVLVTAACEPFTIDPIDPTSVTTTILDNSDAAVTTAALGTQVRDTAAVSGIEGFDPTGTVDFQFFTSADCSGEPTKAGSADLVNGVADGSTVTDPLAAGAYSYLATYNGDANYHSLAAGCENLTVKTAASNTATTITDQNGKKYANGDLFPNTLDIIDTAAVTSANTSFAPTGTVKFDYFQNSTCSGTPIDAGTVALGKGSNPQTLTTAGGASFIAHYSGDANFDPSAGTCENVGTDDVLGLFVVRPVAGPTTEVAGALAFTGGNSTPWALFGAALVGLGGLVLFMTRRRGGATS